MKRIWMLPNLEANHDTQTLERELAQREGVAEVQIDSSARKLTIKSEQDQQQSYWTDLEQFIAQKNPTLTLYPFEEGSTRTWIISGLDCPSCAAKVERAVEQLHDVSFVSLNFLTKKLTVTKTGKAGDEAFWKRVENTAKKAEQGLTMQIEGAQASVHSSPWINIRLAKLLVSFALLAAGLVSTDSMPKALFFVASYLISGYDVLFKALSNIRKGKVFDENFLMSIASLGAMAISQFSEGAAVMLFYQTGEFFQHAAVDTSRRSILGAMNLKSEYARLVEGDTIRRVAPEAVNKGAIVRVLSGEKFPLDGVLLRGSTSLDTQSLTGESVPRFVEAGSTILSGSINVGAVVDIEVSKPYSESTVSKIMALVEDASSHKAPTEQFITSFARYYTPIVVVLAALIAIVPTLIVGNFTTWLYRALVFLVISCPCALVISVPLAYFAGMGKSARSGLLVKGGNYLEALSKLDTMVFDKTGTLTKGEFSVVDISLAENTLFSQEKASALLAILERSSNHPIARALSQHVPTDATIHATQVKELSGRGIIGTVEGMKLAAGNALLMQEMGVTLPSFKEEGQSTVLLAIDGQYVARFTVEDTPKTETKEAIKQLKALGIKHTVMLSGDSIPVAQAIADAVGIDEVQGELLPDQKVEAFAALEKRSSHTAFVGDGINDAPVLARAKVGIAMGSGGSDAAIEAADIVIMTDDMLAIPKVVRIANLTRKIVVQNITFALGVKLITLLLGALGLATMWWAVFADVGVAFLAILNSLRILLHSASR